MPVNVIVYIVAGVLVFGGVAGFYLWSKNQGRQEVIVKQERVLKKITKEGNDAKSDALTAPADAVDERLLKYSRPD